MLIFVSDIFPLDGIVLQGEYPLLSSELLAVTYNCPWANVSWINAIR